MKLYTNPASPFCRKIEVLLHEAGQGDAVEMIGVAGHAKAPGTMPVSVNPIGKIPTLELEDGTAIFDSRVISRYLDQEFDLGLYPEERLFTELTLEATADGIADAALLMVYEGRTRPKDKYDAESVEAQWSKVDRSLNALNNRADELSGTLTVGQIAVGCALGYIDFRLGDRDWRNGRPALAEWFESFAARPSMQATRPSG